eukprot:TRINITY_DN2977_c0_g1_i5.p1 TRINITY_DN2977_c0_g1~~TRINITY_DN2977_c0_g1_i5.p1  ORF type:complete len:137 (+),score=7.94 TRINITY_DN2977_c0_g1_i5:452-862(+)
MLCNAVFWLAHTGGQKPSAAASAWVYVVGWSGGGKDPYVAGLSFEAQASGCKLSSVSSWSRRMPLRTRGKLPVRVFLCGDMNIHSNACLHVSKTDTAEGKALEQACRDHKTIECTRLPTRNQYLLNFTPQSFAERI